MRPVAVRQIYVDDLRRAGAVSYVNLKCELGLGALRSIGLERFMIEVLDLGAIIEFAVQRFLIVVVKNGRCHQHCSR